LTPLVACVESDDIERCLNIWIVAEKLSKGWRGPDPWDDVEMTRFMGDIVMNKQTKRLIHLQGAGYHQPLLNKRIEKG
jgi:hypothetical protein